MKPGEFKAIKSDGKIIGFMYYRHDGAVDSHTTKMLSITGSIRSVSDAHETEKQARKWVLETYMENKCKHCKKFVQEYVVECPACGGIN